LPKRSDAPALGECVQNTIRPYPAGLLRARRERPRRAAEQRDELAAFSITSSVRTSSVQN
jgi:hypothetical protein